MKLRKGLKLSRAQRRHPPTIKGGMDARRARSLQKIRIKAVVYGLRKGQVLNRYSPKHPPTTKGGMYARRAQSVKRLQITITEKRLRKGLKLNKTKYPPIEGGIHARIKRREKKLVLRLTYMKKNLRKELKLNRDAPVTSSLTILGSKRGIYATRNSTKMPPYKILYLKKKLKPGLKLSQTLPAGLVPYRGSFRAALKNSIIRRVKDKANQIKRNTTRSLIGTLDHHREEELDDSIQMVQRPRNAVRKVKSIYGQVSRNINRVRRTSAYIKSRYQRPGVSAYRKVKASNAISSAGGSSSLTNIKTLVSKYMPQNKFSSLISKAGGQKITSVSATAVKAAVQVVVKRIMAAAASNPKVWIIAGALACFFFFLMSISNSFGGSISSAGVYFMTDEENAAKYKEVVDELNEEFQERIEDYKDSDYDDVRVEYMNEDGALHTSWVDIFALVAVEFEQDLEFTSEQENYMGYLFDKFNKIDTDTETYIVESCYTETETDPETGESREVEHCNYETKTRLIVKVYSYDMEDVFGKIGFNEDQREWTRRLVTSGAIQEQFPELAGGFGGGGDPTPGGSGGLTPEEMADIINNLGGDVDKARKVLIEKALTLEGKVKYFWGGKSPAGWNSNWGKPALVTAPGDDTSGTYQPLGLDCSGFIDWAFKTAGLGDVFSKGGTSYQWSKTYSISFDELVPGDLVFKNIPGQGGINHIGIFIGTGSNGENIYIHCEGGKGVVINSYKGFKYPRRPLLFQ